ANTIKSGKSFRPAIDRSCFMLVLPCWEPILTEEAESASITVDLFISTPCEGLPTHEGYRGSSGVAVGGRNEWQCDSKKKHSCRYIRLSRRATAGHFSSGDSGPAAGQSAFRHGLPLC